MFAANYVITAESLTLYIKTVTKNMPMENEANQH